MSNTAINTALTVQAQVAAAQAQAAADETHRERCKVELGAFNAQGATVPQMRSYSQCVDFLYPEPMTQGELLTAKACVFTVLICAIVGAVWGYIAARREWEAGVLGLLGGALAGGILLLMAWAVTFLFS